MKLMKYLFSRDNNLEIKSHASIIRLFLTTLSLVDMTEELELLLGLD